MSSSKSLDPKKPDLCKLLRDVSLGGIYTFKGISL